MGFDREETTANLWILLGDVPIAKASAVDPERVARVCPNRCSAEAHEIAATALAVGRNGEWPGGLPRGKQPAQLAVGVDIFTEALVERMSLSR